MKSGWLGLVVVACSLLAACSNEGRNQNSADLRAVHAVPGAEALDVLVNDDPKVSGLTFTNTSDFSNFEAGGRAVKVRSTTTGNVLVERDMAFIDGTRTTLVVIGTPSAMSTLTLLDDYFSPRSGKIAVRLASFTSNLFAVDLYFGGTDISNATPLIGNVGFGSISNYLEMDQGSYTVVLTNAGTKDVIFRAPAREFSGGSETTIASFPGVGGSLSNAMLLTLDGSIYATNALARVKGVNAITGATLNFKSDNVTFASDVVFTAGSTYTTTPSGAHTLQLESSGVPGTNIATLAKTLDPAGDFTVVAVGTLAQPELVAFSDANILPAISAANVRFANVLRTAPSVNATVNGESKATALAYKSATPTTPITLSAGTTYTFTFTAAGSTTPIASLADVVLEGSAVYTVWLFGPESAPLVRVVRDR